MMNSVGIVLAQALAQAPAPEFDSGWVGLGIQVLLFLGTIFMVIWRTSASTKEVQMLLSQTQPKMDCIRCRAEVDSKITAVGQKNELLEQRFRAIEETLTEIKKSIEELRKEVRARPLARQGTNPRFQMPTDGEDDQG